MEKIEVGEYIRTNKGGIGKVVEIRMGFNKDLQVYQDIYKLDNGLWTILDYIVKHSKQLIDLIEVGDFVNGKYVEKINEYKDGKSIIALIGIIGEKEIKTILTKEQYISNCYKVGGGE